MIINESIHRQNYILLSLICVFYCIQVMINIFIEGLESVFPPAFLFTIFGILLIVLLNKKVNPKVTMYVLVSCMYIYFFFLLNDSPYLVNYQFMWLALPLSALYQNFHVVIVAGSASLFLTFYCYFFLQNEIFPNVVKSDFVYLVLFGLFITAFLLLFIYKVRGANSKLQELAYRDPLTGAANRLLLKKKFDLLQSTNVESIGLLFIDMNGFKKINDTYGHEVGDQLLEKVVSKLNGVLRETDLLCRLGGDEFVILLSNIDEEVPGNISARIQHVLATPLAINEELIHVSASIGWSYTVEVTRADLDQLIRDADKAMYRDKGSGNF